MGEGKGNENIPWIYKGINFQTLGKQIKKYRVLRGLRQSDLAELVFSTTNTISRIEIGGIGCSLENLLLLSLFLGYEGRNFTENGGEPFGDFQGNLYEGTTDFCGKRFSEMAENDKAGQGGRGNISK